MKRTLLWNRPVAVAMFVLVQCSAVSAGAAIINWFLHLVYNQANTGKPWCPFPPCSQHNSILLSPSFQVVTCGGLFMHQNSVGCESKGYSATPPSRTPLRVLQSKMLHPRSPPHLSAQNPLLKPNRGIATDPASSPRWRTKQTTNYSPKKRHQTSLIRN